VQGLLAVGAGGKALTRALAYLSALIAPDGHVRYSRGVDQTPVWVTAEAVMALTRKPLPLAPVALPVAPRVHRSSPRAERRAPVREIGHTSGPAHRLALRRPDGLADQLAGYTGVAAALALAPIGIG